MKVYVALSCVLAAAAGATEYHAFDRTVDLDDDGEPESVVVAVGEEAALRFATRDGTTYAPVDAAGKNYEGAYILDRGAEKHVALLLSYPPSNTEVWVFGLKRGKPEELFHFMADWSVAIVPDGFEVTWKKYRDAEEGGYELVRETYIWDADAVEYRLQR
jgi:hypothetical protein